MIKFSYSNAAENVPVSRLDQHLWPVLHQRKCIFVQQTQASTSSAQRHEWWGARADPLPCSKLLPMRLKTICCTILPTVLLPLFSLVPLSAHAQWTGGVEGGTVFRDEGQATRLRLKLQNPVRPLSQYVYVDWLRTNDGDNAYEAGYLPRYWFGEKIYGFGEASLRVDRPVQIDRQQLFIVGAGYQLSNTKEQSLWAEAGAGIRNTRFLDDNESDDTLMLIRAGFHQILSELFRLELNFDLVDGESLTETTAEAGIAVRIPTGAIKFSYRARRLEPDAGEAIDDDDTFVSFSYGF